MHNLPVGARSTFLSAWVALVVMVSALLVFAPTASANREDCPAGKVCLWAGPTFGGERAFFNGEETGCHPLGSIDPRSIWNHTGNHTAIFPFSRTIRPGESFANLFPWGGEVCIE